jgi:predicted GH43/DUF377 family glycosyl hydrolase
MVSHAANPAPVLLNGEKSIVRVYFTSRDKNNRSHVAYVDIDFDNDYEIIGLSTSPVVSPGDPGEFDDSGASMGHYLEVGNKRYIYYLGWNLKVTVPWLNSIGLAISVDNGPFTKVSKAPIVDRSDIDPYSISYPAVIFEDGRYRMWYGSNLKWGAEQREMKHVIKYAESTDGVHWQRTGKISINHEHEGEYAVSKPSILKIDGLYRMWYSFRASPESSSYRIGYAESVDGISWERKDKLAGLGVSRHGWDSEMVCYPALFQYHGRYFMFYNGNDYGRTGFGIAEAEQPEYGH